MVKSLSVKLIKEAEGFRANPYLCTAGKKTIGYGRNLEALPLTDAEANDTYTNGAGILTVSEEVACRWLEDSVDELIGSLSKQSFFDNCSFNRKAVLVDMAYNLGITKLLKFKKMIAAIEDKDFKKASDEMIDSKWYRDVKIRGKRNVYIMENDKLIGYSEL